MVAFMMWSDLYFNDETVRFSSVFYGHLAIKSFNYLFLKKSENRLYGNVIGYFCPSIVYMA